MKTKLLSLILFTSLLFTACSPSAAQPTEPAAIQPVIANTSIMSEGRLEPVRFAEIAFTASGVISEVLVQEGEAVKKGQPLIRLGDASTSLVDDARKRHRDTIYLRRICFCDNCYPQG